MEFDQLCKRKRDNDTMVEAYSAQITCMLYNINRGDNPSAKIEDFMTHKINPTSEKPKKQSWEEMKMAARLITAAFSGKTNGK